MYGLATTSGGMAIPFYATQRIEMKKEKVMAGDPISEDDGVKIRCKVIKNRLAKTNPFKVCHYYAIYGKGIDNISELGAVLTRENILTKKGAWLRLENESGDVIKVPSNKGEVEAKWNGNANFVNFIREDEITRKYFEKLLDEKLSQGTVGGVSLSIEEIAELEKIESQIKESTEILEEE